jgi:NAD(P)-dependent dehydrogenase (short-subunit alcohol dehydrogenase family)
MEGYEAPFWEQPVWRWDVMFDTGARAHFVASRFAVPLMLPQRRGLIVTTGYPDQGEWKEARVLWGHIVCVAKQAVNNLTRMMAHALREHNVAAVTVAPAGWVWSWDIMQAVYDALRTPGGVEALYRERPDLIEGPHGGGESPEYTGRAVAMLAADQSVMEQSGRILGVDELARRYDFTDIDGRQPVMRY